MLEKQRNTLIKKAFESAKIIAPGTELTALEIDDAAYTLNCMLQGWSNEGFRLFNMKTGYMPLLSKKNEYKLSTEAYSQFGCSDLLEVENIGATIVEVASVKDLAPFQQIAFLNNTLSERNSIEHIDYTNNTLILDKPVNMSIYASDDMFFGNFDVAKTEIKQYVSTFSSITLNEYSSMPSIGDVMFINYEGKWTKVTVSNVVAASDTVYFLPDLKKGKVTKPHVVFGSFVGQTKLAKSYEISPRKMVVSNVPFSPMSVSIKTRNNMDEMLYTEQVDQKSIILQKPVSTAVLDLLGRKFISADIVCPSTVELSWNQILPSLLGDQMVDWGSVNEIPADSVDDWGYITDVVTNTLDFGSLTGTAQILGFAKSGGDIYVSLKSGDTGMLLYRNTSGEWIVLDEGSYAKIFKHNGKIYAYGMSGGLYTLAGGEATLVYAGFDIEFVVEKASVFYLISGSSAGQEKVVVSTRDFLVFDAPYTVPEKINFTNAVEFNGKVYCGYEKTFVTTDMKSFSEIEVYAENRGVVGNVLQNFNTKAICSYTVDGVNFIPMPSASTNVTSVFNIHGCTFIAVYGKIGKDGVVGTQIFTTNEFNGFWTPQAVVSGKVFDMYADDGVLYVTSNIEARSFLLTINVKAEDTEVYMYSNPIGRPQEVMNVVKYGLKSGIQLSMEALALKDYSQLPHVNADGEPVSYCFFRDAKDGTMMIWGTPKQFGEYLKFTYVEPIALLEDAHAIPDIPDEYVGVVIDGLAAELAYEYALPTDKVQALVAKAQESKQVAFMHDNEDVSYFFEPNRRGL